MRGASDAIGFYKAVFRAEEIMRIAAPDGLLMHAELAVGPARFMLSEERPQYGALSPLSLGGSGSCAVVYLPDVDAAVQRALHAGASLDMAVQDQFWGDRAGHITDPYGHKWMVATRIEEPSPEEVRRRVQQLPEASARSCTEPAQK
ncbi:VOC family protein [Roseateles sp. DAIF2]|uniref:VOC family protein n=1 Tax=Roseateles sp. DAIF2 TaxID=2714952 RepID=UPI00201E3B11|nr:VOC family protein [Roseateles sp. DAIF2]